MFPLLRNLICHLDRSRVGWGFVGERSGISYCFSGTLVPFTLYAEERVPSRLGQATRSPPWRNKGLSVTASPAVRWEVTLRTRDGVWGLYFAFRELTSDENAAIKQDANSVWNSGNIERNETMRAQGVGSCIVVFCRDPAAARWGLGRLGLVVPTCSEGTGGVSQVAAAPRLDRCLRAGGLAWTDPSSSVESLEAELDVHLCTRFGLS